MIQGFSGSYLPSDVQFLLRQLNVEVTDIAEKERLIQTGQKHYSEMLSAEPIPSAKHQQIYQHALDSYGLRMAQDIQALALALLPLQVHGGLVLVSFVRAGVPIAVLLTRALTAMGVCVTHYGVSIVRDKGIDQHALNAVIQQHGVESLIFVDGWTGKGAISQELSRSLAQDSRFSGQPRLVTLADPCGHAWLAASAEDWLIPSGMLGATVSGLVSRSLYNADDWHGCNSCTHLQNYDVSQSFIDSVDTLRQQLEPNSILASKTWTYEQQQALQQQSKTVINYFSQQFAVSNINRIKVGIAEATRAVMRRVPEHIFVKNKEDNDVVLLVSLAQQAGITVQEVGEALGQYRALTLIKGMKE